MSKVFVPHDYQYEIIDFIQSKTRVNVFAGMGVGKTASTLTALEGLNFVEDDVYPALVIAPLRVAKSTWVDEPAKWKSLEHLRVVPIVGDLTQRKLALKKSADIFTVNYENIGWLVDFLGDKWPFKTVVADEVTKLKGFRSRQGSKRAKALGSVAHTYVSRFIGLTGTPSPNGLKDLWGPTWFIDRGERLGRSYSAFEARWFTKGYDGYSVTPLPHAQREIEERLKDVCLTVSGLPVDEPIYNPLYIDLPPAARTLYRGMEKEMFIELEGAEVTAVNAAAKSTKCLGEGTEILTDSGWKPIEHYRNADLLWDGIAWVSASKLLFNGYKYVVNCWGVQMTPDHLVLTTTGWKQAQEILDDKSRNPIARQDVRLPNCHPTCWFSSAKIREISTSHLVGSLRVRNRNYHAEWKSNVQNTRGFEILRMSTRGNACASVELSWHGGPSCPPLLVRNAGQMHESRKQGLEKLRRSWNHRMRCVAEVLPSFLGGHGRVIPERLDDRSHRRKRKLRKNELSLGHTRSSIEQQAPPCHNPNSKRTHDGGEGRSKIRSKAGYDICPCSETLDRQASTESTLKRIRVYDIVNCGPRNRFTVRGSDGVPLIVHNCHQIANGACITDDEGPWTEVHSAKLEALDSVIEEAAGMPVLVAYNFRSDLARLKARYPRGRHLDADPKTIKDWNAGKIDVMFIHPKSAGHGLDLQYGGNILAFFSLTWNLEEYMQVIERIGPQRQKQAGFDRPVFVHQIMARNTVDDLLLERLTSKRSTQSILLEALRRSKAT